MIAQVGCLIDVVRDKERRNLLFIEDVREFLAKPGTRGGVERSERLIQEEDFGFENKGAGEAGALRFSAGKSPTGRSARCEMRRRSSQGWTRAVRSGAAIPRSLRPSSTLWRTVPRSSKGS